MVRRLEVEGGWYAMLRIPALRPDELTVLELLERASGFIRGTSSAWQSGWLVLSFLPCEEFEPEFKRLFTISERIKLITIVRIA